jgi:uncharacterized protein YlxW (UPF0749 family)
MHQFLLRQSKAGYQLNQVTIVQGWGTFAMRTQLATILIAIVCSITPLVAKAEQQNDDVAAYCTKNKQSSVCQDFNKARNSVNKAQDSLSKAQDSLSKAKDAVS